MITIDLPFKEAMKFFKINEPPGSSKYRDLFTRTFDINGLEVMLVEVEEHSEGGPSYVGESRTRIRAQLEPVVFVKSKEQLLAEDSVTKAEQALEAAKKTLQQIKEK